MPFHPGQSGNPAGRLRGARNKTTILMETLLERDGEDLIRRYIEAAKEGNARALASLMGVILPKRKGAPIAIDLPPLEDASDAPVAIATVISEVCRGDLTPEEGIMLTRMVEAFLRAKQKVGKLARNAKRAPIPAVKMREALEPHVSRESEAPSPNSAMVEADAARQAGEPGVHSPAAAALQALAQQTADRSLPRLRQEALRSTSPPALSATGGAPIVSLLLFPRVSPEVCAETRAAA
jgi:hypothetical protein